MTVVKKMRYLSLQSPISTCANGKKTLRVMRGSSRKRRRMLTPVIEDIDVEVSSSIKPVEGGNANGPLQHPPSTDKHIAYSDIAIELSK